MPGRDETPTSLLDFPFCNSEDNLRRQLHVEGFAGSDSGRAIEVADCVVYKARTIVDGSWSRSEVDSVKEVEHLRPKLHFEAFFYWNGLQHRKIYASVARGIELVAANLLASCTRRRGTARAKSCGIDPYCSSICSGKFVIKTGKWIFEEVVKLGSRVKG